MTMTNPEPKTAPVRITVHIPEYDDDLLATGDTQKIEGVAGSDFVTVGYRDQVRASDLRRALTVIENAEENR